MLGVICALGMVFAGEQEAARRIYSHLLIHDPLTAVKEAAKAVERYPDSKEVQLALIRALAEKGDETAVLEQWMKTTAQFVDEAKNRRSLEVLAWGVLNKGEHSDQMMIRFNALLGAAFTRDVRALKLLIEEMRGTSGMLRSVAVKLTTLFGDGPLQQELKRMLKEEKVWYVRLEVIRAIGALRMLEVREELKEIVGNPATLAEEKATAILALVSMYDAIGEEEFKGLVKSNRAGLRQLACELVAHLDLHYYADVLVPLLEDASPDVRQEALYTLGLLKKELLEERLGKMLQDSAPQVAITAAWVAMLQGAGEEGLKRWLEDPHPVWRRLAAAALSVTGKKGAPLSMKMLKEHSDPYVRATLAMGLIGQRCRVKEACGVLYSVFFGEKQTLWMWNERFPFRFLSPSEVTHIDHIPNYPHVVDQLARLEVLTMLSVARDPKAQEAMKGFLKNESWGVTGAAAATLLEEGDDTALELVRGLLDEKDEKIRVQAALILALVGSDSAAIKVLRETYPKVDREMKVHILEAMGHIGDPESIPFLVDILKEPFQMLRVVAASALIQSLYH